jgi:hypothetical protein
MPACRQGWVQDVFEVDAVGIALVIERSIKNTFPRAAIIFTPSGTSSRGAFADPGPWGFPNPDSRPVASPGDRSKAAMRKVLSLLSHWPCSSVQGGFAWLVDD